MTRKAYVLLAVLILLAQAVFAQQPRLTNAKLETRSAAAGLEKEVASLVASTAVPAWIAWAVPVSNKDSFSCCWTNDNCGCSLEGRNQAGAVRPEAPVPVGGQRDGEAVKLEGRTHLFIFLRAEQRNVGKLRTFSEDCPLDAGGLPVYWLTDVRPAESVKLLANFAKKGPDERDRLGNSAVGAIALHADPSADAALEQFVAIGQPEWLRSQTAFWLGNARGRKGYELLKRMMENDPSEKVRDRVVFALTQSKEPDALNAVIDAARNDPNAKVRQQAIFWLAQKAGKKAAGTISEAIEKDPDTEVKKRAVFALSQLPKDEGIPLLIQVARANKNPVVRQQAIFWLGQSKDPRALAFFEEVLTR